MKKKSSQISILQLSNPIYMISLFYIVTLIYILYNAKLYFLNWQRIFLYISVPYYIYLFIYFFMKKKHKIKSFNDKIQEVNDGLNYKKLYKINNFIAIISILLIANCIIYIIKIYGFQEIIRGITNLEFIQNIQKLEFKQKSLAILSSNISPIVCIILMKCIKYKVKKNTFASKFILITYLSLIFIFANIIGARVLMLYPIIGCVLTYFSDVRLNISNLFKVMLTVVLLVSVIFVGQVNKTVGDYNKLDKAKQDITDYYSKSLHNGLYIIDNDYKRINLAYWTIKPLFNIPYVSSTLKLSYLYEKYISQIPIKSRQDDFNYVARLGINPKFNTLSIWGYSYLDFGFYGFIVILIQYIILQNIFFAFIRNKKYVSLIYPIIYASFIDSFRNYGIINDRVVFCLLLLMLYRILMKIKIKE